MKLIKKYFPYIYIVAMIATIFYVRNVLDKEDIAIVEKGESEQAKEVKPVDVTLIVDGFEVQNIYKLRLDNTNTFDDLLEKLVENDELIYEKTEFVYGTEYDQINGESAPEGYVWRTFAGEDDITYNTKGYKLQDDTTYKLMLDKE